MPFTGADFDNRLSIKIDRAYTAYFSTAKKNDIVKVATLRAIDDMVAKNDRIQIQDKLFGIYKTNVVFTPTSNTVAIAAGSTGISDYFHALNLKAKYIIPYTGNSVIGATNGTPIRIELLKPIGIKDGSLVVIAGVTGNTNANGQRYVKRITPTRFALYSDINLLTPVAGNGIYAGSGGTISRVFYNENYSKDLPPNRKFSTLNAPTPEDPMFEIANGVIKIYPLTWSCTEVMIDYVSTPTYIDVTDSATDLLTVYSQKFLDFLVDECAKEIGLITRDQSLTQNSLMEMQQP
jgi:hypothetical protein